MEKILRQNIRRKGITSVRKYSVLKNTKEKKAPEEFELISVSMYYTWKNVKYVHRWKTWGKNSKRGEKATHVDYTLAVRANAAASIRLRVKTRHFLLSELQPGQGVASAFGPVDF